MCARPAERLRSASFSSDSKELERYVKYLFYKTVQIVVQSRQGGRSFTESQPSQTNLSWFCLAINDNAEIKEEAKRAAALRGIVGTSQCIEISLKTTEGETMVLETWVLSWKDGVDPNIKVNTVYNQMSLLLKSLLCVTRSTPAYRLSRRQGPETFVICYRVYAGEPSTVHLGEGHLTAQIGHVATNVGTLQMRVNYRTQMTITPSCSSYETTSGSSTNFKCSMTSSTQHKTQPILVKSDHFFQDLVPRSEPLQPKSKPGFATSESEQQTSDESQEAMKWFAASPTSPYARRHHHTVTTKPSQTSSNESLSSNKFYRPRSNTNQSSGSNPPPIEEDNSDIKLGAFVSRPVSSAERASISEDDNDPLLQLFNIEDSKDHKEEKDDLDKKMLELKVDEPAARKTQEDAPKQLPLFATKKDEFVMLDLKTPFSAKASENPSCDLGIFFKPASGGCTQVKQSVVPTESGLDSGIKLEEQLCNLNQQLSSFETNLEEYDDMLKTMEIAATSESESEAT